MSKKSISQIDITECEHQLVYVTISKTDNNIVSVQSNLSKSLKDLYLADTSCIVFVSRLDHSSKACLNGTYSCYIGSFFFEGDNLIYQRNLSGEKQIIQDNQFIIAEDFEKIKEELNQIEIGQKLTDLNEYHKKTHSLINDVISKQFTSLSLILDNKLKPLILNLNQQYECDLFHLSNEFYQTSNDALMSFSIEDKVECIKEINNYISKCEQEIIVLDQLRKEDPIDDENSMWKDEDVSDPVDETDWSLLSDLFSETDSRVKKTVTFDMDKVKIYEDSDDDGIPRKL